MEVHSRRNATEINNVRKPNDWTRSVKRGIEPKDAYHQLQFEFWREFWDYMETKSKIRCSKPASQHWMNHAIGTSGMHLESVVSASKNVKPEIRVDLVLNGTESKARLTAWKQQQEQIEKDLGVQLTWHNPDARNICRIFIRKNTDFRDKALWLEQYE